MSRSPPSAARGTLLVMSAPSGAGKTTLVRGLLERQPGLRFSISYTTRTPRPGERHGHDYFFVAPAQFMAMADAGAFLEHAEVFGNHYGTSRAQVEELMDAGHHVILEIDCQGAAQVRANAPDCRSIFIMPPSVRVLEQRLRGRGTDSEAVIRRRLAGALGEMAHWGEFDYVVINEEGGSAAAIDALEAIIAGHGAPWACDAPAVRDRVASILAEGTPA